MNIFLCSYSHSYSFYSSSSSYACSGSGFKWVATVENVHTEYLWFVPYPYTYLDTFDVSG